MEALQELGLLDHQGNIRSAQCWSLLTDMPSLCSRLTCEDVVHEYVDYSGMPIMVHGDLFRLQGCNVAANKHPLKDLGQGDYIILGEFPFNWHVVPASGLYLSSHKVMIDTLLSAEVADKKAEGGHTEQANWDRVMILKLVPTKLSEVTSKNETKLDKAMVDGTRIYCYPANKKLLQPEIIKAVSESGFKMDGSTKDDKMLSKMESHTGGNVEAKAKEAGTVFIFMEPNTAACTNLASICRDKVIKFLSSCTKFAFRVIKEVARISKTGFMLLLIISNPPPIVSAVGTHNSTPFAPQILNNTPPPPMPPSPVPKGRIRRMGPLSPSRMEKRSNLTESKEWGLPPKKSPPSCLPAC